MIDRLGLAGFFLLHHDMLELAREVALEVRGPDSVRALLAPGRGRGSSVSSLVCYLTGLSHIDPIAGGLALGRFLHEDLHGLPGHRPGLPPRHPRAADPARARALRAAIARRWWPPSRPSACAAPIRELGKVLGLPAGEIERVARGAGRFGDASEASVSGSAGSPSTIWRRRSPTRECRGRRTRRAGAAGRGRSHPSAGAGWRAWWSRPTGCRATSPSIPGGMVIATRPLIDCCPVVPAAMEGRQMVQWDKDSCADAGFLKIDLLGLGMLSAVERCVEEIARVRGERIDLSRIPFDDEETFRAIRAADTVGVFQIESRAQMQSLLRTRPRNLQDLTIQVAIVRPGPIQGGAVNPYIERRQRLREDPTYAIPYEHPALEPVAAGRRSGRSSSRTR